MTVRQLPVERRTVLRCCLCDRPAGGAGGAAACDCEPAPNRRAVTEPPPTAREFLDSLAGRDLWRYQALLPARREHGSGLQVGGTPLLDLGTALDGVRLRAKDETRNPSGSLKDRATEVALAVARAHGHHEVVAASTGNAGASMACIAAAQGLRATVFVPAAAPPAKLTQIRAYGAELRTVDGSYDEAFDRAVAHAREHGLYCRNTGVNPYTREGKKTCALEIAEALGWDVPDWVVVPCGDGNILSGIGAGFAELADLGLLPGVPRLIAAQAASSDSIRRSWAAALARGGRVDREPVPVTPATAADSIAVSRPRDHLAAVRALLRSDGLAAAVAEEEIRWAAGELARRFGLWVEPSTAAGYAALARLRREGTVREGDSAVLLLTGTGLKDPDPWPAAPPEAQR
ncbi:threonine synthase [Kitasatospora phosalacinea]|uniref:threonine synthase n=1 Tax=Kitasatospora phosalacinea TaxID=2065 RepID=UPI0036608B59